jgi:flagellar basal-body rod protein FlgB
MDLNAYLGVHAAALRLREQRTEVLAKNLANADTPGFKARDIDFKSALEAATASQTNASAGLKATQPGHIGNSEASGGTADPSSFKYRTPLAPSLDGNTVDAQLEQAAFAENAVHYQATLTFLQARFRNLMTAITGS